MAKAPIKTETKTPTTEVVVPEKTSTEVAVLNFAADSGAGMEGATQESFAIPFLMVLQKGSPQVDEASGAAIEGAKQGMFYLNVTGKMMDGQKGVTVIPCAYRRVFLRWAPKDAGGGGFKGEISPEEVAQLRAERKIAELDGKLYFPLPDGTVNEKKCDRVSDTRNHYVLLVNDDGSWSQALMSLTSTQIKKSKMLMSALADVKMQGASGMYTPATFANRVRVTTVPEKNDKGSWMGLRFELAGHVTRADMYAAGKAFNDSVKKGSVEVKYEEQEDPTTVNASSRRQNDEPGSGGGAF